MTNQREPSSPEFQLRFPALKGKPKPAGYIHIDEALDRLGKKRLPDRWGKGAAWELQPFWQVTDEGEIEVVRIRRRGAGRDLEHRVGRVKKATDVPREELL